MKHEIALHASRKKFIEQNSNYFHDKLFFEFGVMKGNSMLHFYNLYKENNIEPKFYGFDSFVGLPKELHDKNNPWNEGKFSVNGYINPNILNKPEIKLFVGFFSDTLTSSLGNSFKKMSVGLVHIDCDIYTSTVQCLDFLIKYDLLADGAFIVYDDWGSYLMNGGVDEYTVGESMAHKDISDKYNLKFDLISKEIFDPTFCEVAIWKYNRN